MCSSKSKLQQTWNMNGRVPVLQPNRAPLIERRNNSSATATATATATDDASFKVKPSTLFLPPSTPCPLSPPQIHSNSTKTTDDQALARPKSLNKSKSFSYTTSYMHEYEPGSIAAARREQVFIFHEQRKLKTAHYGRTTKSKILPPSLSPPPSSSLPPPPPPPQEHHNLIDKRCSFITPNSDPIYVAYHDQEWGVPVHNDEMLFELLVLTGAQVGSDWTSVLKRRQDFRDAFSGFDVEAVSKYSEKKINGVSSEHRIELSLVRGAVDNSKRILQIRKESGSLDKYLWGFVNHKTMLTAYKWSQKIPVKTSKSETISKDMVRRGFRQVGPTVIHSFMQAAGLTNDHLLSCPMHPQFKSFSAPAPAPALI